MLPFSGFSVLDLSKLHMFRFHYDVMQKRYDDELKLLFTGKCLSSCALV